MDAVGGYGDVGWPEDYDLLLRLWGAGGRFGKVPERCSVGGRARSGCPAPHPRYAPEAFLACKVHHLGRTLLRDRVGVVVWGAGPVGKAAARALLASGTRVLAFVEVDPRKIGQEIHAAPVLDPEAGLRIGGALHLAAVGQPGARDRLRKTLAGAGLEELADFVAIA